MKKLSYKQKNKMLGLLALIALVICWKFAFSKTAEQFSLYSKRNTNNIDGENKGADLIAIKNRINKADKAITIFQADTGKNEKNLFFITSRYAENNSLTVKEYMPYATEETGRYKKMTSSVTLEGSFKNCLQFVYFLETSAFIGHVSSVYFRTITDPKTTALKLLCTVYVQNVQFSKHEE